MDTITEVTGKEYCSWNQEVGGELEVGDDLGDVGVHLVQLRLLGDNLPVLTPSHRVHNVLGEER